MHCICGHGIVELVTKIRVHYNYETGEVSDKCTKCNCEKALLDDSGVY